MAINYMIKKKRLEKIIDYENFYNTIKINNASKYFKNKSQNIIESPSCRNR